MGTEKRKTGKNQPFRKTKQKRRRQERADRRHDRRRQERVEEVNAKTGKSRKRRDTEIKSEARQRQEEVERRQEREKRKQQNDKVRVRKDKAEVRQGYSLSGLTLQDNLRVHNVHSGFFNLDAVDQFTAVCLELHPTWGERRGSAPDNPPKERAIARAHVSCLQVHSVDSLNKVFCHL